MERQLKIQQLLIRKSGNSNGFLYAFLSLFFWVHYAVSSSQSCQLTHTHTQTHSHTLEFSTLAWKSTHGRCAARPVWHVATAHGTRSAAQEQQQQQRQDMCLCYMRDAFNHLPSTPYPRCTSSLFVAPYLLSGSTLAQIMLVV